MVRGVITWSPAHLAVLEDRPENQAPLIALGSCPPLVPGIDLWDIWPFRRRDGSLADFDGHQLWAGLSAPAEGDPGLRHDVARIRLLSTDGAWRDHGPLFPDGSSLGSREWAGSCVVEGERVAVFYTAAGRRGEPAPTYRQRIVGTMARIGWDGGPRLTEWHPHIDLLAADGHLYQRANEVEGEPGFIKAFRDPFPFRDPADGQDYLLFTASEADAGTDFNGAIGIARLSDAGTWELQTPLVTADGVNNELERPHVVVHDGAYYLFFSTQRRTFHPAVSGPTGLYGFVGDTLWGPFRPLNGSGLVISNPGGEPFQGYSWLVLNDLRVVSFVDSHALGGVHPDEYGEAGDVAALRRHFGGTMAPLLQLSVSGDVTSLVL